MAHLPDSDVASACRQPSLGMTVPMTTADRKGDITAAKHAEACKLDGRGGDLLLKGHEQTFRLSSYGGKPGKDGNASISLDGPLACNSRYTKLSDLARPTKFGFMQLARDNSSGELVAIKCVRLGDDISRKYIESEVLNHRQLQHPCVLGFREVFATGGYICIVMDYASGRDLYSHVKAAGHLPEAACRWLFQQLIIGLDYCHQKGVVNRDLKLDNTLVQVFPGENKLPTIKIADFGYSKACAVSSPKSKVGTLPYIAPEIFTSRGPYDGKKSDIWSCGVMLFWMLFGKHPFQPAETANMSLDGYMKALLKKILSGKWCCPDHIPVSADAKDLLCRILVSDPQQRMGIEEIYKHPWFNVDLPCEADSLKYDYLGKEDYSKQQTEQQIKAILQRALDAQPAQHDDAIYAAA